MEERAMKRFGSWLGLFMKDERGGILVFVAVIIVVLLGLSALAVDAGLLYQTRRQMVNAADAAALAGAQELYYDSNWSNVETYTENYAIANFDCDDALVEQVGNNGVKVTTVKNVDYLFARFLGLTDSDVSATATAMTYPKDFLEGLIPIGIPPYDYVAGEIFNLVNVANHEVFGPGNWGYVDLDAHPGGGVPQIEERIRDGYDEKVYIGQTILTETGNKTAPNKVQSEIQYHIDEKNVLYVPIVDVLENVQTGVDQITILGFAAIILTDLYTDGPGQSGQLVVEGEFQRIIDVGQVEQGAPDYGLNVVKLVE